MLSKVVEKITGNKIDIAINQPGKMVLQAVKEIDKQLKIAKQLENTEKTLLKRQEILRPSTMKSG